jgi:hypothetical protein
MSAYFKTLEDETSDDPDKISEKKFPHAWEVPVLYALNFTLSQD